jgi:hypothetical protein
MKKNGNFGYAPAATDKSVAPILGYCGIYWGYNVPIFLVYTA